MRIISVSRPITGSSLSSFARLVKFRAYFSRFLAFLPLAGMLLFEISFLTSLTTLDTLSFVILNFSKIFFAGDSISNKAKNKCSTSTNSLL